MSSLRPEERRGPQTRTMRPRSPAEALEPSRAPGRPSGRRLPREPGRMSGFVRAVSGVITALIVVLVSIGAIGLFLKYQFEDTGPLTVSRTVVVPKGEGRVVIAARLEREGVIGSRWAFVANYLLQNWMAGKAVDLKAGEYEFKKGASMREVLETLLEGKSVLVKLTIPEGLTSLQVVERIKADPNLTGEVTAVPPEGSLLPDTYRFSKGIPRQELIERMQAEQQRFLAAAWEKRDKDLPLRNIDEAVILASIVEKETGRADERERVAAVFINRLRKGMRLQSDPTIIYGIAGGQGTLGRPITRADIDQKTPYNTYQIDGLPKTPICNAGRPAIEATLNPAETKDLYFVADGTGGHNFSESLKEHNAAVTTWRKIEKGIRAKQEAQAKQDQAKQDGQPLQTATRGMSRAGAGDVPAPPVAAQPANGASGDNPVPLPTRKPKQK